MESNVKVESECTHVNTAEMTVEPGGTCARFTRARASRYCRRTALTRASVAGTGIENCELYIVCTMS